MIKECSISHLKQYGVVYARAFACEPWKDDWKAEDAEVHVRELMECPTAYGIEYVVEDEVLGFLLGTSMLFSWGRSFEINDLAVLPEYQGKGIGTKLLERCLSDMKERGIKMVNLITSTDEGLNGYYRKFGFEPAGDVMLMGKEL
jgi:ribosomal protein S18 acetylase RimI-like enzyme